MAPNIAGRPNDILGAVGWMSVTIFAFLAQMIAVRALADDLDVFEILFIRNSVSLAILLPTAIARGPSVLRTRRFGTHVVRNAANFVGQAAWIHAVTILPLAVVTALEFTVPIWVALLAAAFLGEALTGHRLVAITFGFLGVVVILRPGMEAVDPAALIIIGSAIFFAAANVIAKALTRTESAFTIVLFMQLIQLPLSATAAMFNWTMPVWEHTPWLLMIGFAGLLAHYAMTRALALADATVVGPIDFLRLPITACVAYLLYEEGLNVFVLAGAGLIFVGNFYGVWREHRSRHK
jgi:drug/metabolite transporter (DMT)-like permease